MKDRSEMPSSSSGSSASSSSSSSSNSNSSSTCGSVDSAAEELQSLRHNKTPYPHGAYGDALGFEPDQSSQAMMKSHNDDSSPTSMRMHVERDDDDDVFMTTMRPGLKTMSGIFEKPNLVSDPFGSKVELMQPMANSTTIDNSSQESPVRPGSIRFAKNVTFHEWENFGKKKTKSNHKPADKLNVRGIFRRRGEEKFAPPSSDYSATPDTTDQDLSRIERMSLKQLEYEEFSGQAQHEVDELQSQQRSTKHIITSAASSIPESIAGIFSPDIDIGTGGTEPSSTDPDENRNAEMRYDSTMSLSRKFNNLSLDTENEEGEVHGRDLFSLRLRKTGEQNGQQSVADESYEQIDILNQSPPNLPSITKSMIIADADGVIPLFKSLNEITSPAPSQLELDVKRVIINLLRFLETSAGVEHCDVNVQEITVDESVDKIHSIVLKLSSLLEVSKIQLLRFNKQLAELRDQVTHREFDIRSLRDQVRQYTDEYEKLKGDHFKLTSQSEVHQKLVDHERQINNRTQEEILDVNTRLDSSTRKYQLLEQRTKQVIWMIQRSSSTTVYNIEELIILLKDLFNSHEICRNELESSRGTLDLVRRELSEYNKRCQTQAHEITKLQAELQDLFQAQKSCEIVLDERKTSNEMLMRDNSEYKELLKRLEGTCSEQSVIKDRCLMEIQQVKDQNNSLRSENEALRDRSSEMERVLNEQIELVTSAQSELEQQTNTIQELEIALEKERTQIVSHKDTMMTQALIHTRKCNEFELTCEKLTTQIKDLQLQTDSYNAQQSNIVRLKDEEMKEIRQKLGDAHNTEGQMTHEIKTLRLRLSDKFSETTAMERKLSSLSKLFQEAQELGRTLRTELLRNGVIKQELKRAMTGLSIGVFKEFEGVIDSTSLSTVRDRLSTVNAADLNANEDSQLEKLNDAALFIEEAVRLIVNENWSLTKRLNTHHKGALLGPSQHLQKVVESQNEKLRKLEMKLSNYESAFRSISRLNQRDDDGAQYIASSTHRGQSASLTHSQRSSSNISDRSDDGRTTLRRIRDNAEIQRQLARLKKDNQLNE